jgi:hypothetical protein
LEKTVQGIKKWANQSLYIINKTNEGFQYIDFGKYSFSEHIKLWINKECKIERYLYFPIPNAKIIKNTKGTHILVPCQNSWVHYYEGKEEEKDGSLLIYLFQSILFLIYLIEKVAVL